MLFRSQYSFTINNTDPNGSPPIVGKTVLNAVSVNAPVATSEHFNEIKEEAVHLLREINDMDVDALEAAVKRVVSYKMNITDYLDVISVWYRDVLIYKATKNVDQVVFSDQLRFIKDRASKSSYEGIENILDGIEKAKARLKANVNFELTMELLLLTIKEN